MFEAAASFQDYNRAYFEHLHALLMGLDRDAIARIAGVMDEAVRAGRRLFFIANGGSAAIASHWVNDLVAGAFQESGENFKAFCLSDNVASVTAIGNDSGYDNVFLNQLKVHLEPGDVVYAMSVSGNSENIVRAVAWARTRGARTIALCGFDGGRLLQTAEFCLHIPASRDEYGPVEDAFSVLEHVLSGWLTMRRGKRLHH